MRKFSIATAALALLALAWPAAAIDAEHVIVFDEEGRFGGWPANNGMYAWGDEIVVGFTLAYYKKNPGRHAKDYDRPAVPRQARSLDGGETWTTEIPNYLDENDEERPVTELEEPVDFSHPDLAVRLRNDKVYYSTDRAKTWSGPHPLPTFGRPGLLARTAYLVEGPERLTAFVAAEKDDGGEGQTLCIRTEDSGLTWEMVGWIGPQPPAGYGYAIMPAAVRIGEVGYLAAVRRAGTFDGQKQWWLETYMSPDDGERWYQLEEPYINNAGNPATLTRLEDGAIAMTYGWRDAPYGIRARVSRDDGRTWTEEVSLRADGLTWDIGYPRTVVRADGKCVTTYYFTSAEHPEQHIAATIWDPRSVSE